MSEVAVAVGADTAPVAAPVVETAPATPDVATPVTDVGTPEVVDVRSARSRLRHPVQTPPTPAVPRDEGGRFAAPEGTPAVAVETPAVGEPETGGAPITGEPAGTTQTPTVADGVPEGMVVLEVPEGHYLRERGREKLPPMPKEWENDLRGMLNDPVRRAQVAQAEAAREDAVLRAQKWEKVAGIQFERIEAILADPQTVYSIAKIRESQGDEAANRYISGLMQEDQSKIEEVLTEVDSQAAQARAQQTAREFSAGAHSAMQKAFPAFSEADRTYVIQQFGNALTAGQVNLHWNDLQQFATRFYENHPAVKAQNERESLAAENARLKAEQDAAAQAATQAAQVAANPMGRVHPGGVISGTTVPGTHPIEGRSVHDAKRALRRRS